MKKSIKITASITLMFLMLFLSGCKGTSIVKFETDGGTQIVSIDIDEGNSISEPQQPQKEGYTFLGWYSDSSYNVVFDFAQPVVGDITLYAKWETNTYSLSFIDYAGNTQWEYQSEFGTDLSNLVVSAMMNNREGYTFTGWDIELPSNTPANNMIFNATYSINQYTMSFDSNEGNSVSSFTEDYGTIVNEPTEPTKEGYTFDGWYSDELLRTAYTFTTIPAEDTSLYAKWNLNTYDIVYQLDGGTNGDNLNSYTIETTSITFNNPTKEGFSFIAWFNNAEYEGEEITNITMGNKGDITLYARWEINQYTLKYITYDDYNPINDIALHYRETIVSVSLGGSHSSVITSEGRLLTWGDNYYGQLGDGTTTDRYKPIDITSHFNLNAGETIVIVSLGSYHSSAITSKGRIFTWGDNSYGQLGDGTTTDRYTPIDITSHFSLNAGEIIASVSLGGQHSAVTTSEGRIFTWGRNSSRELGDETTTDRYTPIDITSHFSLSTGETIVSVSLGGSQSSAITSERRIFTWGDNGYGQLGDGTTTDRQTPTEITSNFNLNAEESINNLSFGFAHSSAITSEGRVFTWGSNFNGRLGDGTTTDHYIPIDITTQFSLNAGETIIKVLLGSSHSSAITSEGRIYTWGSNYHGQLGDGTTTGIYYANPIPIEITQQFNLIIGERILSTTIGGSHSLVTTSLGRIFTWGSNDDGKLGDNTIIDRYTPILLLFNSAYSTEINIFDYDVLLDDFIPTKEGYTFDGWYSDVLLTKAYMINTMPADDIKLYGKWILN